MKYPGLNEAELTVFNNNQDLVVSIAAGYKDRGLDEPELLEEGQIGLGRAVEALRRRDVEDFTIEATYWIQQAIRRAVLNGNKTNRSEFLLES